MSTIIDPMDRRTFLRRALAMLAVLSTPWGAAKKLWALGDDPGNFRKIYLDAKLRERFYPFLVNVFHLLPEKKFQKLLFELSRKYQTDEEIYRELQKEIPSIKPAGSELTYALPALKKQKQEMTRETLAFLGSNPPIDGYLEIGTTGRYISELRHHARVKGPIYLVNDVAASYGVSEIMERGGIPKIGHYVPMGNYDPFAGPLVPENVVDVVTNFIGFHHCPPDRLEGFVSSIRKVLRPGGKLILRDHDVDSPDQDTLVALAHDVFNAGVKLSWEENHHQVRHFHSIDYWSDYLGKAGLKRTERRPQAQAGDPTKNLLVEFVKV